MRSLFHSRASKTLLIALVAATPACDGGAEDAAAKEAAETGAIRAALTVGGLRHDVVAVHYKVVAADGSCGDAAIAETTSALEEEALPELALPPGSRVHAGADGLFVLPPGVYRVCATPLGNAGPSVECAPAEATAAVYPEGTSEITLVSQCAGAPNGGLDVVAALNDPPTIDDIDIAPSKFITQCETAAIAVTASDPDGDAFWVDWELTGGAGELAGDGGAATFTPAGPGVATVQVTVTDVLGGSSRLSFPVHVSAADCGGATCSDGIQNQGETGVDCGGPCAPCGGVSVYSFVDTPADDVGIKSLYDFFSSLGSVSSSQYILFEIVTNEGATAWCSENAAFYVDTYVAQTYEGGGGFQSGPWNKYWRVAGGPWSGPDTGQYWNFYAASCDESPYSWCAEWDLGGYRWAVMPHHTVTNGESYFDWSYSNGENWVVTIAVGDDRLSTCGF
ncbi:Ig-like domain-containing protein [Sorangium sp. So ce394]|uniref:Ig-like domain-containing protein n=1 Tax=Sorangium sp. So ce394 TaxID=3133310 RepID=UPI003F5C9AF2